MASESAWNEGWAQGREASQHRRDRKEMLSDEDRQIKANDLINTRNSILSKLPTLLGPNGEKTPEYDQAYQSLTQAQEGLGQLYHPDKAPGALQSDWHWLLGKMHGITAPKDKTPPPVPPQPSSVAVNTPAPPSITPAIPADPSVRQEAVPATTMPGMNSVPKGATPTMAVAKPKGLVEAGTIPIWNRPSVLNDDGTHSSELSISMGDDKGNQVLIPLIVGGKFLTPDGKMPPGPIPHNAQEWEKASPEWKALKMRAWQNYEKTGEHLGKFGGETAEDDVDAYAQVLHNRGSAGATTTLPVAPSPTVTKAPPVPWGQAQVLKHKAAAMQKAQQEAGLLASGAPLSPQQEAMSQFRTADVVHQAQVESTLKLAEKLGLSETAMDELKQQLVGLKNVTPKPLTGAAGQPYLGPDGTYRQAVTNPDGSVGFRQMPPDWKPNTKAVRGTIVNTKSNGWIQTWVDPYNPSKVIGFQKVAPGSRYAGTTSGSSSTDPFGLTTSSSRSTTPTSGSTPVDFDLSGMRQLPDNFNGEDIPAPSGQAPASAPTPSGSPNKSLAPKATPPKSVTTPQTKETPKSLKNKVPAPPSNTVPAAGKLALDETGHIPTNAPYNASLIGAANQLLDGMDITKLTIPQKAKEAASNLARAYGWGGQGMFTPREALQLKEGATFLNMMANSPALKVLDNGFFANIAMTGASPDPLKEGFFGRLLGNAAARGQTPDQQKFMDLYRQLDAMAIGLRALVQTGRGTQKQTDLLISELPNPYNTPSSADAKRRLGLVQKELDIAAKTGHLPEFEDMQKDFNSLPKSGKANESLSLDDFKKKHNLQ